MKKLLALIAGTAHPAAPRSLAVCAVLCCLMAVPDTGPAYAAEEAPGNGPGDTPPALSTAGTRSLPVPPAAEATAPPALVQEGTVTAPTSTAPAPQEPDTFVDSFRGGLSRGLLTTAVWLDSFFGDERYEAESNQSHFKVSDTVFFEDGDWIRYRPDYELRLVLPQLRQKTRLVISGDIWDQTDGSTDTPDPTLPAGTAPQDREMNTSLQVVLPSHDHHSTTIRGGIKYHSGEIIYYGGPRYRYLLPLNAWSARFTEDMIWGTDKGWESKTRIDLERPLPRELFFRASSEGTWTEGVDGYVYSFTVLLRQPLDFKRAVEYEWVNSCHTRPITELTEVKVIFRYRQQIWRPWFFLEIAPQYRFPRDRGFEETPGINFKLEMVFSK